MPPTRALIAALAHEAAAVALAQNIPLTFPDPDAAAETLHVAQSFLHVPGHPARRADGD